MQRIAKFEKVSFEQYKKDFLNTLGWEFLVYIGALPFCFNEPDSTAVETKIREIYDKIKLPERVRDMISLRHLRFILSQRKQF